MSGYDIKRLLKSLGWLIDGPSLGNIYSTLHALCDERLVSVEVIPHENKPPRKVYSIKDEGRRALEEWANRPAPPKMSLKAFLMRLVLAGSFSQDKLMAHLQQRRAQVDAQRTALQEAATALGESADSLRLAFDFGLALAATELTWLDSALIRLSQQPLPLEVVQGN